MKQQHYEARLFLERKQAIKVAKALKHMGFIEALSSNITAKHDFDNFRIVIYHQDIKKLISETLKKSEITWVEKDLSIINP